MQFSEAFKWLSIEFSKVMKGLIDSFVGLLNG